MNRSSLKWHKTLINIAADPVTHTIHHKMGPLMVALKALPGNCLRLTMTIDKKTDSYLVPVTDVLRQCGVE